MARDVDVLDLTVGEQGRLRGAVADDQRLELALVLEVDLLGTALNL